MTTPKRASCRLDELPDEITLHIISYLEPDNISALLLVCRQLRSVCLDDELWKSYCFENSAWYNYLLAIRRVYKPWSQRSEESFGGASQGRVVDGEQCWETEARRQKRQDMANWDPVFPDEKFPWYDEYVQRHGAASVNWLESPRLQDRGVEAIIEARGMALYTPNNGDDGLGTNLAVSPMDDGSVCLWDINGSHGKRGGIIARSREGILYTGGLHDDQSMRRSKKIDTGVTECVSVNNRGHTAFFAVQNHLVEVDLNRLEVVSRQSFEWTITTLSKIHDGFPLTVGTSLGIHLHDFRYRARVGQESVERVDGLAKDAENRFTVIFDPRPLAPYAPLAQPTPTNILHLPCLGTEDVISNEIYVAGRFPGHILHYDRRKFPRIMGSIHTGSRISSLACIPYPFFHGDPVDRRMGRIPIETIQESKTADDGRTLIAGGEYNTKGSLELYGLSSVSHADGDVMLQKGSMQNRLTAASALILSVINHGTKIAFSDGAGLIKWFERDGLSECRRIKIGCCEPDSDNEIQDAGHVSMFRSTKDSDEMARKILSTKLKQGRQRRNDDNILFWTGERLGMVSFTPEPLFSPEDFEDQSSGSTRSVETGQMRRQYRKMLRAALARQADEARIFQGLGPR